MAIKPGATPQAREAGWRACVAQADARAAALAQVIAEIRAGGITTPHAIAAALTARGIPTARGHRFWSDRPVRSLLNRVDRMAADAAAGICTGLPWRSQHESREPVLRSADCLGRKSIGAG
jgi:hypothetical protein